MPSATGTFISEFGSGGAARGIRAKGSNLVVKGLGYILGEWTTAGVFVSGNTLNACGETDFDIDSSGNFYGPNENGPPAKTAYKLNSSYSAVTSWTQAGMDNPLGVCTDSSHVYISDYIADKVFKFDLSGAYVADWSVSGAPGNPIGLTIHPSGDIMVCGTSTGIRRYTNTGALVSTIALSGASSVAFDSSGNMYAVVNVSDSVSVYDSSFSLLGSFGTSGSNPGQFQSPYGCAVDSAGFLHVTDTSRQKVIKFTSELTVGVTQTEFNSYTTTVATSLGTPDGGVSIPSLNGLNANGAGPVPNHILDMRTAIETLAPYFTNAATGNPYNWTASSDNLYFVAMGDRSAYGATGGAAYDWTRNEAAMINTPAYGLDIGEVASCLDQLEAS